MTDIRIDSHKLMYHPHKISNWLFGTIVYPVTAEISLTNSCNHRCIFCALDYTGYKKQEIDTKKLLNCLTDMAKYGLKSIVLAGEGEPLLHKDVLYICQAANDIGLDIGLSTNGVLLHRHIDLLQYLTWIRFSVGGLNSYDKIHGVSSKSKQRKLAYLCLSDAVQYKHNNNLPVTIGVQTVLLNENVDDVIPMARILKDIGVDYYTIKPFSKHPQSKCNFDIDYVHMLRLEQQLSEFETDNYKIYFRSHCMQKACQDRQYDQCHGMDMMAYISASGNMYPCIAYVGNNYYKYGNINTSRFYDIWASRNKENIQTLINSDMSNCRKMCRLDEINTYLHKIKHPDKHVNFI